MKLLLLLPLALCSCAVKPTIRKTDGTLITLGGSLFEDTDNEIATYSDGTMTLAYQKIGKKQTKVPLSAIRWAGSAAIAGELTAREGAVEATNRTGIKEAAATQRNADTLKEQTEQLRIVTP